MQCTLRSDQIYTDLFLGSQLKMQLGDDVGAGSTNGHTQVCQTLNRVSPTSMECTVPSVCFHLSVSKIVYEPLEGF